MGKKLTLGLIVLGSFALGFVTKGNMEFGKPAKIVRNPGTMLTGAEIETQFGIMNRLNVYFSDGNIYTLEYIRNSLPGQFINPFVEERNYPEFNTTRQDNLREDFYI